MTQLQHLFDLGGPTMWAIAGLAVVGACLFFERLFAIAGLAGQLRETERQLRETALRGSLSDLVPVCRAAPGGTAPVLLRGVEAALRRAPRDEVLAEMARDARRLNLRLKRGLGLLATLGTMAPFVGLFGTVLGIMEALRAIGKSGTGGLDVVATGVSEALVTTAAGILVAVIMVVLHQLLRGQLLRAVLEVQVLVEDAADQFAKVALSAPSAPPAAAGPVPVALVAAPPGVGREEPLHAAG